MEILAELKKDYIASVLGSGKRIDGRGFGDYRSISVEAGYSNKAEGSAFVKLGNTQVLVGVKLTIGEPFPDMPDSGVLTTSAELKPMAAPTFEAGPPDEDSIEIARVVDRCIREGNAVDLDKLCITPAEKVWIAFVDIHVLDYDGNLFDASTLGAMAALIDARFPKVEGDKIIYTEKTNERLPILHRPLEVTFAKIGNGTVLDPILDEEMVMDARLTVATTEEEKLCAMQKGGEGTFTQEEIFALVDKAKEKGDELRKYLPE